jgi:hypothetical protein
MSIFGSRLVTVVAFMVAGLAGVGAALAQPPGFGRGGGSPLEHLERQVSRAGLAPETTKVVYQQIDQARAERRSIEASLDVAHDQLRSLLDQDGASADVVMAQADAVGALETQLHKLELRTLLQIRGLVTPAQWKALSPKRRPGSSGPPDAVGPPDGPRP